MFTLQQGGSTVTNHSALSAIATPENIQQISDSTGQSTDIVSTIIKAGLPHILGQASPTVDTATTNKVAKKTGIDTATVIQILIAVAPFVIAYLTTKNTSKSSSSKKSSDNPLMDVATSILDKNKDGSIVDDVLGMFTKK